MAGSGSQNLGFRLDIKQILSEAQHRWLRPAEICEILRNYQKFHITPEPPFKPVSGSVFLFDRKVLRYFRKDGHNWRKKKDGKTVKEAHEKLKVGSIDMLHCYYAHGEENENFQRRSYWMLEQDLMHIVFVHYLEVKGNKTNINCLLDNETISSSSQNDSSLSFSSSANGDNLTAAYTDTTSPTSTLTSAYEEAECAQLNTEESYQSRSRVSSYPGTPQSESINAAHHVDAGLSNSYSLLQSLGNQTVPSGEYMSFSQGHGGAEGHGNSFVSGIQRPLNLESWEEVWRHSATGEIDGEHQYWNPSELQPNWQYTQGDCSVPFKGLPEQNPISSSASDGGGNFNDSVPANFQKFTDPLYMNADGQKDQAENGIAVMGSGNGPLVMKQPQLNAIQIDDGLKKVDSFSRWMAKELGEVAELHTQSNNGYSWSEIQTEDVVENSCMPNQLQVDADTLNFSLSQDQLFSITEFSPNWAYSNLGTKVIIIGKYLKPDQAFVSCRWSCMFGEVEVSAMVLGEGVLCCEAPPHKPGLVPFYVTCSNRLACSEVREFEYRAGPQDIDLTDIPRGDMSALHMYKRLERLLSTGSVGNANTSSGDAVERDDMVKRIISLKEEDENHRARLALGIDHSMPKAIEEQQVDKSLKERFYEWLLHKVTEDGKGPSVIDDDGQGVLHLAAALGFNWALKPIIVSGVSVDFRDVNGWTALHWAAFYGREDTVVALVSLGAACGAVTDPSAEYPLGRSPADLASAKGHKGISGFLAECSLTKHLSLLTMKETKEENNTTGYSGEKAIQTVSERVAAPISGEDVPESLSLKDSLAAVCNATQAAARIHQIFRIQSFQRKQLIEQVDDSSSEEQALSILAAKTSRMGRNDVNAHAAAISIQKKYRGWKKRKEFLIIRERIVKIQAHVRGHQARKKYKPIIWSVGILEKVILRWRRKGSGLRGFRPDAVTKGPSEQDMPPNEDDYDFLKEGRKQAEERMQKALSRVKSMAQYPEARAQYRRLITVAEGFRGTKDASDMGPGDSENTSYPEEDLFDVENLLDDDTFMSIAFE